jgi:hypothetical protein
MAARARDRGHAGEDPRREELRQGATTRRLDGKPVELPTHRRNPGATATTAGASLAAGLPGREPAAQGLWLAKDSPSKFKKMFDRLERLEKWVEEETCPDEYPQTMRELYGECPSLAGEKIRLLVLDYFSEDEAARHKACRGLPQWLAQERGDVERERELYQREMAISGNAGPNQSEEEVARKEAALERQIREHTRLLLQLKTTRSQWGPPSAGLEPSGIATPIDVPPALRLASSGGSAPCPSSSPSAGTTSGGPTAFLRPQRRKRLRRPFDGPSNGGGRGGGG